MGREEESKRREARLEGRRNLHGNNKKNGVFAFQFGPQLDRFNILWLFSVGSMGYSFVLVISFR